MMKVAIVESILHAGLFILPSYVELAVTLPFYL